MTKHSAPDTSQLKEEMEFRMSLLRLMTVPHDGAAGGVQPALESSNRTLEELSGVLVPVKTARRGAGIRSVAQA